MLQKLSKTCANRSVISVIFTSPPEGVQSIVMSMSAVCLSVHSHDSKTIWPIFTKFLCMLPVAVAGSSSDGVAIC